MDHEKLLYKNGAVNRCRVGSKDNERDQWISAWWCNRGKVKTRDVAPISMWLCRRSVVIDSCALLSYLPWDGIGCDGILSHRKLYKSLLLSKFHP